MDITDRGENLYILRIVEEIYNNGTEIRNILPICLGESFHEAASCPSRAQNQYSGFALDSGRRESRVHW